MAHVGQKFRLYGVSSQRAAVCQIELDILLFNGFHGLLELAGGLLDLCLHIPLSLLEVLGQGVNMATQVVKFCRIRGRQTQSVVTAG